MQHSKSPHKQDMSIKQSQCANGEKKKKCVAWEKGKRLSMQDAKDG